MTCAGMYRDWKFTLLTPPVFILKVLGTKFSVVPMIQSLYAFVLLADVK